MESVAIIDIKKSHFSPAWLIRDASQQRLSLLISRIRKNKVVDLKTTDLQIESLAKLIVQYRKIVKSFEWDTLRDVFINRLEGSRRSLQGHTLENSIRLAVSTTIQTYTSIF